jgi:hypothetical protein
MRDERRATHSWSSALGSTSRHSVGVGRQLVEQELGITAPSLKSDLPVLSPHELSKHSFILVDNSRVNLAGR